MAKARDDGGLDLHLPSEPSVVSRIRTAFEQFAGAYPFSHDEIEAVKVALSEACSNAVCHGSPGGAGDRIHVSCRVEVDRLVIEVSDQGGGFQPSEVKLPEYEEWKPSGRGLFLMQELMDDVRFEATPEGTRVRLTKVLRQDDLGPDSAAAPG